tara:strand:+ start:3088 stop:3327 length:240 start_codon:yes stop_codon:yes gene_type:complete
MDIQDFIDFLESRQCVLLSSLKSGAIPVQSDIFLNGLILSTYSLQYEHEFSVKEMKIINTQTNFRPGWSFIKTHQCREL